MWFSFKKTKQVNKERRKQRGNQPAGGPSPEQGPAHHELRKPAVSWAPALARQFLLSLRRTLKRAFILVHRSGSPGSESGSRCPAWRRQGWLGPAPRLRSGFGKNEPASAAFASRALPGGWPGRWPGHGRSPCLPSTVTPGEGLSPPLRTPVNSPELPRPGSEHVTSEWTRRKCSQAKETAPESSCWTRGPAGEEAPLTLHLPGLTCGFALSSFILGDL